MDSGANAIGGEATHWTRRSIAPPRDLAPFIGPLFFTTADHDEAPGAEHLLLARTALVQVIVGGGVWRRPVNREWMPLTGPVLVGGQSRAVRLRTEGKVAVVGFAVRPAGWFALNSFPASAAADRIDPLPGWGEALADAAGDLSDIAAAAERLFAVIRARVAALRPDPNDAVAAFERIVRRHPNISVNDATVAMDVPRRPFDRLIRHHFGHPPKVVLRRSRLLTAAKSLGGVACVNSNQVVSRLFYDPSHLHREFKLFLDMTPGAFVATGTRLLMGGLVDLGPGRQAAAARRARAPTTRRSNGSVGLRAAS